MSTAGLPPDTSLTTAPEIAGASDNAQVEVAHEALIRHWDHLQAWLGEDRGGLRFRQEISDAASAWEKSNRKEDYAIHKGERLRDIAAFQRNSRLRFNGLEAEYVRANAAIQARNDAVERRRQERDLKIGRWLRWVSTILVVLLLLAIISTVYAVQQRNEALDQQERAEREATNARVLSLTAASSSLARGGEQDQLSALLAAEAFTLGEETGLDGDVGTALQASIGAPYFSRLLESGNQSPIASAAFDRTSERIVVGKFNGEVVLIRNPSAASPVTEVLSPTFGGSDYWVSSVAFSPDGRYVAAAAYHGAIQVWDVSRPDRALVSSQLGLPRAVYSLTFGSSPADGLFLLASGCAPPQQSKHCAHDLLGNDANVDESGSVGMVVFALWSARSGFSNLPLRTFELPGNRVFATALSEDGRWLAAGGCKRFPKAPATTEPHRGNQCEAGFLYVQDLQQIDSPPISLDAGDGAIMAVAFAPGTDGMPRLAAGGDDRIIRVWQPSDQPGEQQLITTLVGHNQEIRSLSFSPDPDSALLVSGGYDGNINLWNLDSPHPVLENLGSNSEWVRAVSFDATGKRMLSTAASGQIRLWDIIPNQPLSEPGILRGHASYVRAIAFGPNPDEPMLVSAAEGGTIRIWHIENGAVAVREIPIRSRASSVKLSSVAFSADGSTLIIADERGVIWKIDPRDPGAKPVQIGIHSGGPLHVAFNPNHTIVAAGGTSGVIQLWDASGDAPQRVGRKQSTGGSQVWAIAFSRDGTLLAAGTADGNIHRWRVGGDGRTLEALPTFTLEGVAIRSLALGPGNELVTGDSGGTICFWGSGDPSSPSSCPKLVHRHTGDIRTLAFNHTGDLLASGGIDQTVRLWDPRDPDAAPVVIPTIMEWVRGLAFSPDGRALAVSSSQGTMRIIIPDSQDLRDRVCTHTGRNMTGEEWSAYMQHASYRPTCPDIESSGEQEIASLLPLNNALLASLTAAPLLNRPGRRRYRPPHPHRQTMQPAARCQNTTQEGSR